LDEKEAVNGIEIELWTEIVLPGLLRGYNLAGVYNVEKIDNFLTE